MSEFAKDAAARPAKRSRATLARKTANALQTLSVEPVAFLFMFSKYVSVTIVQNLTLEKVCRFESNLTQDVCDRLHEEEFHAQQDEVQRITSDHNMYRTVVEHVLPVFLILFIGPWSDRNGRKIPIVLVIVGQLLQMTGYFLNAYFMEWDARWILVLGSLPYSMGGTRMCLLMSVFSYVADITDARVRTMRVSILDGLFFAGQPLGSLGGAFLYRRFGYLAAFGAAMAASTLNILYSVVFLRSDTHEIAKGECGGEPRDENRLKRPFHNPKHILDALRALFRKRPFRQRTILLVLSSTIFIGIMPLFGEYSVDYLFTQKQFDWNEVSFSVYNTYYTIITTVGGTFILVPLLSYKFSAKDTVLGGVGVTLNAFCRLCYAFSRKAWQFYAATPLAIMSTAKGAVCRSLISKVVPNDELGKIFAMIASAEALVPIVASVVYSRLYSATLNAFIGSFYLLSSSLLFLVGAMYLYVFHLTRKHDLFSTEAKV